MLVWHEMNSSENMRDALKDKLKNAIRMDIGRKWNKLGRKRHLGALKLKGVTGLSDNFPIQQ